MTRLSRFAWFLIALLPLGCSAPDAFDETTTPEARDAPLPEIAPLDPLLAPIEPRLSEDDAEQLLARGRATARKAANLP